jgi:dihydroneopterin aldolase
MKHSGTRVTRRLQSQMKISIVDLEVFYRVGVPDAERAQPQRLLLTVEMEFDFSAAAKTDSASPTRLIISPSAAAVEIRRRPRAGS